MIVMKSYSLNSTHFKNIKKFLDDNDIRLLITDINGVIDNYYDIKFNFLSALLGESKLSDLPHLWTFIEQSYINNKTSIESGARGFYESKNMTLDSRQQALLEAGMQRSKITAAATTFLDDLKIECILYTSMNSASTKSTLDGNDYKVYFSEDSSVEKPSSIDLQYIIDQYNVSNNKVCMIGDGLIDDLMPASLFGIHTILVTPYAQELISLQTV